MLNSQGEDMSNYSINMYNLQGFESFSILYGDHQLAKLNLWNGNVLLIFLFSTNDLLDIDFKDIDISTSLLQMADFI